MGQDAKKGDFLQRTETFHFLAPPLLRRIATRGQTALALGVNRGDMHSGMLKALPEQISPEVIIGGEDNQQMSEAIICG